MTNNEHHSLHERFAKPVAATILGLTALTGCGGEKIGAIANTDPTDGQTPSISATETPGEITPSVIETPVAENTPVATHTPTPEYSSTKPSKPEATTDGLTKENVLNMVTNSFDEVIAKYSWSQISEAAGPKGGNVYIEYSGKVEAPLRSNSFSKLPYDKQLLYVKRYEELQTFSAEEALVSNDVNPTESGVPIGGKNYVITPEDFVEASKDSDRGKSIRKEIENERRRRYYTVMTSACSSPIMQKNILSVGYGTAKANVDFAANAGGLDAKDTPKIDTDKLIKGQYIMIDGELVYDGGSKSWIVESPVVPAGGIGARLVKTKYGNFLTFDEKHTADIPETND